MIIDNPVPGHLPALRQLWRQAFGDPEDFLDSFFDKGFAFDRCRCVFQDGEPVAAVYRFDGRWDEKKVAYLYALAVEKSHREQGLSRLLLADTHAALQREGFHGAILEPATQALQAYYQRLGYRLFGSRQEKVFRAAGEGVACTQLGQLGYEQARKSLMPQGSIAQEGALTEFLQTQAELWGGEGFVAAVSRQAPHVLEFLGDQTKLSGLLMTLGMEEASVWLPGGAPTSMYLSFDSDESLPAYFGLPMD